MEDHMRAVHLQTDDERSSGVKPMEHEPGTLASFQRCLHEGEHLRHAYWQAGLRPGGRAVTLGAGWLRLGAGGVATAGIWSCSGGSPAEEATQESGTHNLRR